MLLRYALITIVGVAAIPATSMAAFKTCQDASNYGWNTAQLFAGQTFKRIDCDAASLDKAITSLANSTTRLVFSTTDTDVEKRCLFTGYYSGLLQRTSLEFDKCHGTGAFGCVSAFVTASYAAATFVAAFKSLGDPGDLDPGTIDAMLPTTSALADSPVGFCALAPADRAACSDTVRSFIARELSYAPDADVAAVVGAACKR
jgi:hypothetical protein